MVPWQWFSSYTKMIKRLKLRSSRSIVRRGFQTGLAVRRTSDVLLLAPSSRVPWSTANHNTTRDVTTSRNVWLHGDHWLQKSAHSSLLQIYKYNREKGVQLSVTTPPRTTAMKRVKLTKTMKSNRQMWLPWYCFWRTLRCCKEKSFEVVWPSQDEPNNCIPNLLLGWNPSSATN